MAALHRPRPALSFSLPIRHSTAPARPRTLHVSAQAEVCTRQGVSRKQNEDRYKVKVGAPAADGKPYTFLEVYDGHGGFATAEYCRDALEDRLMQQWIKESPSRAVRKAFINVDTELLETKGFLGLGERGVGGSKCGCTAAFAVVYKDNKGATQLMAANCGDARVLICEDGKEPVQLTVDHVPDEEIERARIEAQNPNPKMPLVTFANGTYRVGGLLALSRAFGDAFMKEGLNYEGLADKGNAYGSGFGVIADPSVETMNIDGKKGWVVVSSDGLNTNEERGGGGGLDNSVVSEICAEVTDAAELAKILVNGAQAEGSTDDVTVVCVPLQELY